MFNQNNSIRNIQFKIILKNQINFLDVLIEKQIDMVKFLTYNEKLHNNYIDNEIIIVNLDNDDRLKKSNFINKYKFLDDNCFLNTSLLELCQSPEKYYIIKKIYENIKKHKQTYKNINNFFVYQFNSINYDEFEYKIDMMLEELKLFLDKFQFDNFEQKIIDIFISDEKLKSNIKFIGWFDNLANK